jgi:predicted nucleic acid-binding Zn ribbon protein
MTEPVPHKHCVVCGNAVGAGGSYCDELCEIKFKSAQRRQQMMFGAFIVIMALILLLPSLLKMTG